MSEQNNNNEQTQNELNGNNETSENKYLSQLYSFLNPNYIKSSFESKAENAPNKNKNIISTRKAYRYLIRKFKKVIIECDLYYEEVQIKNENVKLIIHFFGKNSITLKKLYKKRKVIDNYFFILILFNILSNFPYPILPIQKFIDICDNYISYGVSILLKLNSSLYNKKKKVHKIYFEPVFYLFTALWNNHYFHVSLSNTLIILTFFYKIYIILSKLEIRNVNLFDNIYVLCSSYVNKVNSMLWFSIFLTIKRMLIDECEIKIIKKKQIYLILPIFVDIIKILEVYDEIIKKTNINPLIKVYEKLKLFLFEFFHKLLYNLITKHDILPRNIFKYLQINNNIISNKKKKSSHFNSQSIINRERSNAISSNQVQKKNCKHYENENRRDSIDIYSSFYKYANSINEKYVFYSFFENFVLFNSLNNDYDSSESISYLSFSFNSLNSLINSENEESLKNPQKKITSDSDIMSHTEESDTSESDYDKPFQLIKMHKNKIEILNMKYDHFFIHKYKTENKCILLIKSYFNDYLCALVNSLYIYSKTIYFKTETNEDSISLDKTNTTSESGCSDLENLKREEGDIHNPEIEQAALQSLDPSSELYHPKVEINENSEVNGSSKISEDTKINERKEGSSHSTESDHDILQEFNLVYTQKIEKEDEIIHKQIVNLKKYNKNRNTTNISDTQEYLTNTNQHIIKCLISFLKIMYKNIFKKVITKIKNCKNISDLKLYSYIEKICEYNTYYCIKRRLKNVCFILFFSITLKNLIKNYLYKIKNEKIDKKNLESFQSTLIYDTCSFIKIYNYLNKFKFQDFYKNKYINFLIFTKNVLTLPRNQLIYYPIKNKHFFYYIKNKRIDINFADFVSDCKNNISWAQKNRNLSYSSKYYDNILHNQHQHFPFSNTASQKVYIPTKNDYTIRETTSEPNVVQRTLNNIIQSFYLYNTQLNDLSSGKKNNTYLCDSSRRNDNSDRLNKNISQTNDNPTTDKQTQNIFSPHLSPPQSIDKNTSNSENINCIDKQRKDISELEFESNEFDTQLESKTFSASNYDTNKDLENYLTINNNIFSNFNNNNHVENGDLSFENFTNYYNQNFIRVYVKNEAKEIFDRKILIVKNNKIYFYDSEYSISYDSFYYLMEIKKIYYCNGLFDSLVNSQRFSLQNSTYSSTGDSFCSKGQDSFSSENEWQKCGFDAKIIFHNELRKHIHLMFIDQSYKDFVEKINNSLVHETERTFEYINLSYDKNVENAIIRDYFFNKINYIKDSQSVFSENESESNKKNSLNDQEYSESENEESEYVDESLEGIDKKSGLEIDDKHETKSSDNDIDENDNVLNKILKKQNNNFLNKHNKPKINRLEKYNNFVEYKYSSSATEIFIKSENIYFSKKKKKKIKIKKEKKMKLFKNIKKNDIYNLFYDQISKLCKHKNPTKNPADDLFFYKSVNSLYNEANSV
ncbi:hypothetical protein YYG_04806 [Plasmodium vinckei petteri]|uniref:Uncharacterized protein n=1 Tax=Plasmodium vinckei petteri TaxID=138298 RepID=W7A9M2_PLAVN|nr:hypothetical protein YYG_04806 [Plasmodium vinckei petteri]CAD2097149.1 conserved Plasmodium protein, unknown function [Plasmodium vinckei petteri]